MPESLHGSTFAPRRHYVLSPNVAVELTGTDGYKLQMGRWSRRFAEPLLDFAGSAPAERLLDVGCGTGCLSFAMARQCRPQQVIGIDISPAYVEHATHHNRDANVAFQIGDACAIAFPDQSFDRALSLLVLHFVPNAQQAIAEMRRVTRPGGVVGAAVWDARGGFVANRLFYDTVAALDSKASERRARTSGKQRIEVSCMANLALADRKP